MSKMRGTKYEKQAKKVIIHCTNDAYGSIIQMEFAHMQRQGQSKPHHLIPPQTQKQKQNPIQAQKQMQKKLRKKIPRL